VLELVRENGGWLRFDRFMEAALYDAEFGYYSARIRHVGPKGDFSTSAHADSLLGRVIARWALEQRKRLRLGWRWNLIEAGGGTGELAATVLKNLGVWGRAGLTYHLVEISKPLRERQRERLRGYRVRWHDTIAAALDAVGGVGLIFSNELVDAYPCRRFHRSEVGWEEVGLMIQDGKFTESFQPLNASEQASLSSSVFAFPGKPRPQLVEVHASYLEELQKWAPRLVKGCVLTIDYGDRFPTLYHRQPGGTLRGYFHHQRVEGSDLYTRLGQQDLTADVNFTDLETWGAAIGWRNENWETQREFIHRFLAEFTPRTTDEARLMDPVGAGGAFKVLQQSCAAE
jgi:SAM-dependent MidA family methyltransferase